ncbi:MAG: 3'-5' exonuclease, partial [Flavobacteriales bacterium]
SQSMLHSREALEEERRLFYVAITRAEKRATLSYALSRYRWGKLEHSEPSRFLDDIDAQYLDIQFAQIKSNPDAWEE